MSDRRLGLLRIRITVLTIACIALPGLMRGQSSVTVGDVEQQSSGGQWDTGSMTLTVDGRSESVPFGQFSTAASVAAGLAARFTLDCNSSVYAKAVGPVITFKAKNPSDPIVQISSVSQWDTSHFSHSSFGLSQSQGTGSTLTASLSLSCAPNPIPAGGSADCTAQLPAGATGTVNFALDGQSWATAIIDGGGWAPASTLSGLTAGNHTLLASYSGDSTYMPTMQTLSLPVATGSLTSSTVYSYKIKQGDDITTGYAPNSNIAAYNDNVNGRWSLQYDGLNRLAGASMNPVGGGSAQYMCWNYDSFGNRTIEATSPSPFQTNAPSACTSTGTVTANLAQFNDGSNRITGNVLVTYDEAGNIQADGTNSYLYDGEGRVCAVGTRAPSGGTLLYQYVYDANGTRVAKGTINTWSCEMSTNGFVATNSYVLGQGGEQVTEMTIRNLQSSWAHTNVYAGGMLLATYDPAGLHFHLSDWLGSRRVQTNALGQVEERCINSPFGNGLNCLKPFNAQATADDATEHHFTGKERDSESGLDYFGARYYTSGMGRFMSPDPESRGSNLGNPQSLNGYSYVFNNPMVLVDPSGAETALYRDGNCFTYTYDYVHDDENGTTVSNYTVVFGSCGGNLFRIDPQKTVTRALISILGDAISKGRMNQCNALANYVDASTQTGVGTNDQMGPLTPGSWPISEGALGITTNGTNGVAGMRETGGESGFLPQFQNTKDDFEGWNGDQIHHFAAFFQNGYGNPKASQKLPTASVFEKIQARQAHGPINQGDINLGIAAEALGRGMANGSIPNLGDAIRNTLCEKK